MPPKLDDDIKRLNIIVPAAWARRVDNWRRHQDDLPNFSEAIRRLVEIALEREKKPKPPTDQKIKNAPAKNARFDLRSRSKKSYSRSLKKSVPPAPRP
jgi:hypothetical protein